MRMMSLLLILGLGVVPFATPAQSLPRVLQCEDCTPLQMEELAIELGQTAGGAFHVFSLRQGVLSRYWVDYDHDGKRWVATPVPPQEGMADVFGHMQDAYRARPEAFIGRQEFRSTADAIGGGPHDSVEVSIRGRHDSAYGRFINAVWECFEVEDCAAGIDPALAAILLAQKQAWSIGLSLLDGTGGGVAWEGPPPRPEVLLCNPNDDCALVEYRDGEWTYMGTRADGGLGKRYPEYGKAVYYDFADAAEAAAFERGLRGAGGRVGGTWQADAQLACETAWATASCDYRTLRAR